MQPFSFGEKTCKEVVGHERSVKLQLQGIARAEDCKTYNDIVFRGATWYDEQIAKMEWLISAAAQHRRWEKKYRKKYPDFDPLDPFTWPSSYIQDDKNCTI
jgi:hypothetical protein